LAATGAKVGTLARRLSSIRFAHAARDLPDPTAAARVQAVWKGPRRIHGAPPDQAAPLMPPQLFDVLDACPTTRTWKTRGRSPEPDLAGGPGPIPAADRLRRRAAAPQRTGRPFEVTRFIMRADLNCLDYRIPILD
jgi:hypothetical protein